ncbi:hypothetical protein BVC71_09020 [Marivivens niveibacter]|uniref:Uncharacterized protein n=1 Tax=Marivivens niveibacter TaxID=1930667 RepID=A0A251WXR8_9RHOB|nr:hypothetical protein BVC71_09020 [Marivivens niveibacter]
MSSIQHKTFQKSKNVAGTPRCCLELFLAVEDGHMNATNVHELSETCQKCPRRNRAGGWISNESSIGVWSGCAHQQQLKDAMKR